MTAKKDLKRLVRERQQETGERYTTALAHVRSNAKRGAVEVTELHDVTSCAELDGLRGKVAMSDDLWRTDFEDTGERRFHRVFERLRALLQAVEGEKGAAALCAALLRGEHPEAGVPNATREIFESQRFWAQVHSGVRGVSRNGRLLAFDVPSRSGSVTVVGVFVASPIPVAGRQPVLWLMTLRERKSASLPGLSDVLATQLALAGVGGFAEGT